MYGKKIVPTYECSPKSWNILACELEDEKMLKNIRNKI